MGRPTSIGMGFEKLVRSILEDVRDGVSVTTYRDYLWITDDEFAGRGVRYVEIWRPPVRAHVTAEAAMHWTERL